MPGYDYLFNNTGPTGQNEIMPPSYNDGPPTVDPMSNLMAQQAGIFEGPNSYDNNSAPMINQGNPYRLSSNRQPGVDMGNDMYSPQEGGIMRNFQNYLDENRSDKLREYMKRGLLARQGIETLEANVDPSDWRVIQQIMGAGGNPDDYIETADSYAPINLFQMLRDAQDAEDEDLIELLQGDLEMMYPSLV